MGTADVKLLSLWHDLWDQPDRVSQLENDALALSFLPKVVDEAVWSMKIDTAPVLMAGQ